MRRFNQSKKSVFASDLNGPSDYKNQIKLFDFHSEKHISTKKDSITSFFIDPGTKNCAIRCVKKSKFAEIEKEVILFELLKLGKKNDILIDCMINTIDSFKKKETFLINCDYIVIEKQLSQNLDLTRQMQNIETAIMCLTKDKGSRPIIVEVDSRAKTRAFEKCTEEYVKESTKSKKNRQTKIKGEDAAMSILKEEHDDISIEIIEMTKKKDDLSDVCCYEYIWWQYVDKLDDLPIKFS